MPQTTLSPHVLQQRFVALAELTAASPAHHVALVARASGRLDEQTLAAALASAVAAHDALGLSLGREARLAVSRGTIALERAEAGGEEAAVRQAAEWARRPIDPRTGPLVRALHLRLPDRSQVALAAHRLVADHTSLEILAEELSARYDALRAGDAPPAAAPDPFTADVPGAAVAGPRAGGAVSPELELPHRMARPAVPALRGATLRFGLDAELRTRAGELAGELGVPPTAVFLAALQVLLRRHTGQLELLVGVELDRRPRPGAVGPYADLALVPSRQTRSVTFRELVRAAGEHLAAAVASAPAPVPPFPCRAALTHRRARPAGRWSLERIDVAATDLDLHLTLTEPADDAGGLDAELVYDRDLLAPELARALADHYVLLVESALAGPDGPVARLRLLGDLELRRLLHSWNGGPDLAPVDATVHRMIECRAAATPEALALTQGDVQLTYRELDARANRIARGLRARGAGHGDVVALAMDRSWELLVTLLAAFKVGAIAVTLDPRAPRRRMELALTVSPPAVLVTLARLGIASPLDEARTLMLDREGPPPDPLDEGVRGRTAGQEDIAYLVQTSGSTGVPKAVAVPHGAIAHCAAQQIAAYPITPADRASWLAPAAAATIEVEVLPYLCAGASVHIADPDTAGSPPALRDWLVDRGITQAFVIAPLAEILNGLDWPSPCALRFMCVAGEKVRLWAPADLPFEVAVLYGAAEACYVTSSLHPWAVRATSATGSASDRLRPPPIGRPWVGVRAYVLDDELELVPPGAIGELCVDSPELAYGYLGDAARTADKFVPNPLPGAPGSRLYRTGDLASHRADGLLDHRGRTDAMVKIRGHRVEVAEVETVLLDHPRVAQAVVVAATDPGDQRRLVAYLVTSEPVATAELRAFVAERLPEHMVPSAWVVLDRLPLTASNKVDRLALPPPDWESGHVRQPYAAPTNELETALVEVWSEILGGRLGVDDSFFDAGGDSLLAARLLARVRERLQVDVTLRDLLLAPTPGLLARALESARPAARRRELPPVTGRRRR